MKVHSKLGVAILSLCAAFGLSSTVLPAQVWAPLGPGAATGGQIEGIVNRPVTGAIEAVAAHPTNPNILYIGAVNGGVFKTANAMAGSPAWTQLTDAQASLSIGALEFDPSNSSILVAGIGRTSSYGGQGGAHTGILRTTNAGATWTSIALPNSVQVSGVAPRGATIVVAAAASPLFSDTGIYRSTNTGASWTQISGAAGSGLPIGRAFDLAGDPTSPTRLFTIIRHTGIPGNSGVYRSDDTGATWTKISSAAQDSLINAPADDANLAVGRQGPAAPNVFAAICTGGRLAALHRTGNGAVGSPTWASLDLPTSAETSGPQGVHPGGQCSVHLSLLADPTNHNLVYIGGDRQPDGLPGPQFPNSLGALDYSGRLYRVNAALAGGSQAQSLTHCDPAGGMPAGCGGVPSTSSNSSPHADSREMAFSGGSLIEVDDGGIYRRSNPTGVGDWFSLIGNLPVTEQHDMAHDGVANITISGNQDTGSTQQMTSAGQVWDSLSTADGGDVAVAENDPVAGQATRYSSSQNFGGARRRVWNAANVLQSSTAPTLIPLGGAPAPSGQFITPLAINGVAPARVILGAGNGTYESFDRLDTVTRVSTSVINYFYGRPVAYGAAGNADALYFGSSDDIFVRTAAPPAAPVATDPDPASSDFIDGIVIDPDSPTSAFAMDRNQVFRTTNAGTTWSDITGNLGSAALGAGTFRSIEYINTGGDRLLVGADTGVFVATEASGFSTWTELGTALPNAPVFDLDFDGAGNRLTAGTMGRGAWRLNLGGGSCSADLTLANQTLASAMIYEALTSITLGPSLIANGPGIEVQAPTITILNGATSFGGTFTAGNSPVCP